MLTHVLAQATDLSGTFTAREWTLASILVLALILGSRGVWSWGRELADKTAELAREREGREADRKRYDEEMARMREELERMRTERNEYRDMFHKTAGITAEALPRIARQINASTEGAGKS